MIRESAVGGGIENLKEKTPAYFQHFEYRPKLVEPQHQLAKTPRIPGLDGRKMSKSYGNTITLRETDEEIRGKTKEMVTDTERREGTDRGNAEVCPLHGGRKLLC